MEKKNPKGWLYLLPAIAFLGVFMVYPLVDVLIYSLEEGYNFASQTYFGIGSYNYQYVLHDPYFLQALKNTFILVVITVPLSTTLALLISVGLSSIQKLRELFQTNLYLKNIQIRFEKSEAIAQAKKIIIDISNNICNQKQYSKLSIIHDADPV